MMMLTRSRRRRSSSSDSDDNTDSDSSSSSSSNTTTTAATPMTKSSPTTTSSTTAFDTAGNIVSPPPPLAQPERTPCIQNQSGGWCNVFERPGKYLRSEIVVQRGILQNLEKEASAVLPGVSLRGTTRNYLVTDSIVDELYGGLVLHGFRQAGVQVEKLVIPAVAAMDDGCDEPSTEPSKNARIFHELVDQILRGGISKHSCIISLGGAVTNNLCGVLAAMLYRGIKLVHIATTTMSALDGALDFKQAFNHSCGKNLLGAYYPADTIVIDPEALQTLTTRHALNGVAEALKHGLTQSRSLTASIVEPLRASHDNLRDPAYLERLCRATIEVKVPTLTHYHASDFNEMVPQYGHAPAHAIEHLSWHGGRSPLLHGEAVAIGMCVAAECACLLGLCADSVVQQHYDLIAACGLPTRVPADEFTVDDIIAAMRYDKHFVERPVMGLCKDIGVMARRQDDGAFGFPVDLHVIREAFARNMLLDADM